MKITITTIEASAEELKANRSLSDALMDALIRTCNAVSRPEGSACTVQEGGAE